MPNLAKDASESPWKVGLEVRRLIRLPYHRLLFALRGMNYPAGLRLFGTPLIQKTKGSEIVIGENAVLNSEFGSNPLAPSHPVFLATRKPTAKLVIGKNFGMTGGTICAAESVVIGDDVIIGGNCTITDTDFHPIGRAERKADSKAGRHRPVVIGNGVFVGMNCIILKGTVIEDGAVIGAGSVVSGRVTANSVWAGSPARLLKPLE